MIVFNVEEFIRRLGTALGSEEKAHIANNVYEKYQFMLGLYRNKDIEDFFESQEDFENFLRKYESYFETRIHDPSAVEAILKDHQFTEDQASAFTRIEEEYMVELGLM